MGLKSLQLLPLLMTYNIFMFNGVKSTDYSWDSLPPDLSYLRHQCRFEYPIASNFALHQWAMSVLSPCFTPTIKNVNPSMDSGGTVFQSTQTQIINDITYALKCAGVCKVRRRTMFSTNQCGICIRFVGQQMISTCPNFYYVA